MDSKSENEELKWKVVKKHTTGTVPVIPSDVFEEEKSSGISEAITKSLRNPFVPAGLIATCACLIGMFSATKNRDLLKAQYYMRGRIAAQAFTVTSLVIGGLYSLNWDLSVFFKRSPKLPKFSEVNQ